MLDLELVSIDELADEISRRTKAYVLITEIEKTTKSSDFRVWFSGGVASALGLSEYCRQTVVASMDNLKGSDK